MSQVGSTQRGVLVRCDPAVKQFILHLDQKYRFVIADLDETSVFLDASSGAERIIKEGLEQLNKDNTYESDQPDGALIPASWHRLSCQSLRHAAL